MSANPVAIQFKEPVTPDATQFRSGRFYRPVRRRPGANGLLGIAVHNVSAVGVLDNMADVIEAGEQAVILHANAFAANLAARNPAFRSAFGQAQMVFCDGDGIRRACQALGLEVPPKVTYARWLPLVAAWCEERGYSLYLLGGRPGVADLAAGNLKQRHPRIRIAGARHGYFEKAGSENDAVIAEINRVQPDVLLVCFGMPLQEDWVVRNASGLAAHVLLTGGAALDYAAGIAVTTPQWMIRLELEWLFRLWRDPIRLFTRYAIGNPEFALRVAAESARQAWSRRAKRVFDLSVTLLASVTWLPAILASSLSILACEGRPLFYVSRRRVFRDRQMPVVKFRTMRRDAERIANRDTIPISETRFLNLPPDSPLYTRVGWLIERCCFTELPQLFHVLAGKMSLVGNRPLPENVIAALKAEFPWVEARFDTPAGLTGPAQLVGRDRLSDRERLEIETMYCRVAASSYSMRLDFQIILGTVLVVARLRQSYSCDEIKRLIARFDRHNVLGHELFAGG